MDIDSHKKAKRQTKLKRLNTPEIDQKHMIVEDKQQNLIKTPVRSKNLSDEMKSS
jgi:hypothetical protein